MAEIKYQYAYDENGNTVSVKDLTKDTCKLHTYKCIGCGNILLPRAIDSKCRRPHFYHKELVNCSSETYLHKLGKKLIKQKFYESNSFFISYKITKDCSNKQCQLRNINCQQSNVDYKINLREYYDTCKEEVPINGYVADILLTNSSNPNIPPLLIEICVTHPCDEEKIKSGLKIIEISISNEEDIAYFYKTLLLEETSYHCRRNEKSIKMISFNRERVEPLSSEVYRFVYNPIYNETGYTKTIKCQDASLKIQNDSLVELNMVKRVNSGSFILYDFKSMAPLYWLALHNRIRLCSLCKFYYATMYEYSPTCRLSKYGKPKYPLLKEAEKCNSFYVAENRYSIEGLYIEEVISSHENEKTSYRVLIAGSSSFKDRTLFNSKCDFYLKSKLKTHNVIFLSGTSWQTAELTRKYAEEHNIGIEFFDAKWGKYGNGAGYKTNEEMLQHADALLAFWDGNGKYTESLIFMAKAKGIPVAVVKYETT